MSFPCRLHWQGIVQAGERSVLVHRPQQDSSDSSGKNHVWGMFK